MYLDGLNAVFVLLRFRNIRHGSYAVILSPKTPYSMVGQREERNRAKEIIEDFMIAANGVTARFLHGKKSHP